MTNTNEATEPTTTTDVDALFTTILDAINKAHHAGYTAGRYASNAEGTTLEDYRAAQDAGNKAAQAMWHDLYTYAAEVAAR